GDRTDEEAGEIGDCLAALVGFPRIPGGDVERVFQDRKERLQGVAFGLLGLLVFGRLAAGGGLRAVLTNSLPLRQLRSVLAPPLGRRPVAVGFVSPGIGGVETAGVGVEVAGSGVPAERESQIVRNPGERRLEEAL